jgi:Crp-like helix-turn-helix domain
VTRRLIDADRKRVEFGAHDSVGRVARRLIELVERYGEPTQGGMRITLPISQDELAGWVGISRKAVHKRPPGATPARMDPDRTQGDRRHRPRRAAHTSHRIHTQAKTGTGLD